ncbi:MAG TPA: hypothetical protein VNJ01_04110 [Bacteriovoracaceae bacterium]|nr:hypothetical protein [Bacteriovoracaceae bacterium]
MIRSLSFLILIMACSPTFAKSVLDVLQSRVEPEVSCASEAKDELAMKCIASLCKDTKVTVPMFITDPQEYIEKTGYKVSQAKTDDFTEVLKTRIQELDGFLRELEKSDLAKSFDDDQKFEILKKIYDAKCTQVISPNKLISVKCSDPLLEKSPVKVIIQRSVTEQLKNNWDVGLAFKYYTHTEIPKLLTPKWKKKIKRKFNKLVEDDYVFMNENLNGFVGLNVNDRIRFIKIVSFLQGDDHVRTVLETKAIGRYFNSVTKTPDFKNEIIKLRKKINAPDFFTSALASLETQAQLESLAPTAEELFTFEHTTDQVKEKIRAFQKAQVKDGKMSQHSAEHYAAEMDKLLFTYASEAFNTGKITPASLPFFFANQKDVMNVLLSPHHAGLYEFVGAGLGTTVALINDRYVDPLFRDLGDSNFGKAEIRFSLFSLKNPEFGKQILAHELGHHFSYLQQQGRLSEKTSQEVAKAKACISSRYQNRNAGVHYIEEDFADEWSFALFGETDPVYLCPLLQKAQGTELASLEILKNPDLHPPVFWRALNQFLSAKNAANTFPQVCSQLIENAPHKYKKCIQ